VIAAMSSAAEFIIAVASDCFETELAHRDCVEGALGLAESISELGSFALDLAATQVTLAEASDSEPTGNVVGIQCFVDVSSATTSLLDTYTTAVTLQQECKASHTRCAEGIAATVERLASVAEFIFASIRDCSVNVPPGVGDAASYTSLVATVAELVEDSIRVSRTCKPGSMSSKHVAEMTHLFPEYTQWVKNATRSGETPQQVNRLVETALLKDSLHKAARKFSVNSRRDRMSDLQSLEDEHPSSNAALLGAILMVSSFSFFAGRRHGRKPTSGTRSVATHVSPDFAERSQQENWMEIEELVPAPAFE